MMSKHERIEDEGKTGLRGRFLFLRRAIGLALILILFIVPLVRHEIDFLIALFVVFPGPLMTIPFLAMALYLLLSKKTRRIDIVVIFVCTTLLLSLMSGLVFFMLFFLLPLYMFSTPLGLLLIPILTTVLAVILRRRGKRKTEAQKLTFVSTPFACPSCGRDLSTFPKDIVICPYCGGKLTQRTCPSCSRDLSQFPTDIKNCPYCGKAVSTPSIEAPPAPTVKATELPAGIPRIRRYSKMMALFGILIAISFFILIFLGGFMTGPEPNAPYMFPVLHENTPALWNGVYVGALLAIFSAIVRTVASSLARAQIARGWQLVLRWILGVVMIVLSVIPMFFGMRFFFDWYAPGLLIAICLLIPKKYSMRASIVLLALALIFALWPRDIGLFGPSLSDTWLISIALSSEAAEWGLGQIVNFWALLTEKILSVIAGVLLVARKI